MPLRHNDLCMELRHFRYFLAVGEALSFTKAAARLRIAQPALSRQVQDLEEEIGVDLFKRSPRGVTLTAEGKLFLAEVRELLKRIDESVVKVRELARGHYGDLHVGYASSFTVELMPPAVAAFEKQFPRVNLVLHDVSRAELIEGLESGALELGGDSCCLANCWQGPRNTTKLSDLRSVAARAPLGAAQGNPFGKGRYAAPHRPSPEGKSGLLPSA